MAVLIVVAACAPRLQSGGPGATEPRLTESVFTTSDGLQLPVRTWRADDGPTAIIVGVHGYGDYSYGLDMPATWWAEHGVTTYAYDQRGFGKTPEHGIWPGVDRLTGDLRTFVRLVGERHPNLPLFIVGVSMGGAVTMAAFADGAGHEAVKVDGLILNAPAVWGRVTMNSFYRATLWLTVRLIPGGEVSGSGLNIRPSDNIDMLRALGRDPLIYKTSRVDTVYGLVNLMDAALESAERQTLPTLLLYGARDEIIPAEPVEIMRRRLTAPHRVVLYPDGWHMLFRDLQAETVWRDVLAWISDRSGPLPSNHEHNGGPLFARK